MLNMSASRANEQMSHTESMEHYRVENEKRSTHKTLVPGFTRPGESWLGANPKSSKRLKKSDA